MSRKRYWTKWSTDALKPLAQPVANCFVDCLRICSYDQYYDGWDTSVVLDVDGEQVRFFHCIKKGVHRVFIDHPW